MRISGIFKITPENSIIQMAKKIVAAAHDPGGAQAMAPVLAALSNWRSIELSVYAGKWAQTVFNRYGIDFKAIETDIDERKASSIMDLENPALLFTGTSWNSDVEQELRNQAARRNKPSIVLLDFWSNYALRFRKTLQTISSMPDKICVMDTKTKDEMLSEGFVKDAIVVTGQPHVEKLFREGIQNNAASKSCLTTVLLLTQPNIHKTDQHLNTAFFRQLAVSINLFAVQEKRSMLLLIKPHPKEVISDAMHRRLLSFRTERLAIELKTANADLGKLLDASHWVIGNTSMALFESRARNKITYAIITENINSALERALLDIGAQLLNPLKDKIVLPQEDTLPRAEKALQFHRGATERVIQLIKDSL